MSDSGTAQRSICNNGKIRRAEYYGMLDTFDTLYADSCNGKNFNKLLEIIESRENILLAYRNIKANTGSLTAGVDGKTIGDIKTFNSEKLVDLVKRELSNYHPRAVRRVEIPKANGKTRPLGIPTIIDRLVQQCILQVIEPICEAKFHERSNGFRPNRLAENAIAQCARMVNVQKLYFVVDLDIKGFFDNVDHGKLLKQIWTLGIRDKRLICIISKMLKAPILLKDGTCIPNSKGTPQGGILSPLLANIVLNELDWWISSQWESIPTKKEFKSYATANGSASNSEKYKTLKTTRLKEQFIIRYADDVKIFCRSKTAATKVLIATEMWLKDRLKLDISKEKSGITDLRKRTSEFLGFQLKAVRKGEKVVLISHMCPKAQNKVVKAVKELQAELKHPPLGRNAQQIIGRFNALIRGAHNYYQLATCISLDMDKIAHKCNWRSVPSLKQRIGPVNGMTNGIREKYGKCKQMIAIDGCAVVPVSYVKTKNALYKPRKVNKYTKEGRELIYSKLDKLNEEDLRGILRHPVQDGSVEYNDNRLSKYSMQCGKCAVTGVYLRWYEIHCHHRTPREAGGSDRFSNLVIISQPIHILIHATQNDTIQKYLEMLNLTDKELMKVNQYRLEVGCAIISLNS